MSITLLRWKAGSGGDTILKMLLESHNDLKSQNQYVKLIDGKTTLDPDFVKSFPYKEIAKMSSKDYTQVDKFALKDQLIQLHKEDPKVKWLLKTHCYMQFDYPTIDIVVDKKNLPFVVKAGIFKNLRSKNLISDYHPLIKKITDPKILHKFDCYNFAYDLNRSFNYTKDVINLNDMLSGWDKLNLALTSLGFNLKENCKDYFEQWLKANLFFLPSKTYIDLIESKNYDFNQSGLSIEERYCLLVLAKEKFQILS